MDVSEDAHADPVDGVILPRWVGWWQVDEWLGYVGNGEEVTRPGAKFVVSSLPLPVEGTGPQHLPRLSSGAGVLVHHQFIGKMIAAVVIGWCRVRSILLLGGSHGFRTSSVAR